MIIATIQPGREAAAATEVGSPSTFSTTHVVVKVHTPASCIGHKNQFVFCGNSPVNFVDPFGLIDWHSAEVIAARKALEKTTTGSNLIKVVEKLEKKTGTTVHVATTHMQKSWAGGGSLNLVAVTPDGLPYTAKDAPGGRAIAGRDEILFHELVHQWQWLSDPKSAANKRNTSDPVWKNLLEKQAVDLTNKYRVQKGGAAEGFYPRTSYGPPGSSGDKDNFSGGYYDGPCY